MSAAKRFQSSSRPISPRKRPTRSTRRSAWTGVSRSTRRWWRRLALVVAAAGGVVREAGAALRRLDDGNVWKSPNDGASNGRIYMTHFPGLPPRFDSVSRVEPSPLRYAHRVRDVRRPSRERLHAVCLSPTNDWRQTFAPIVNDLPKDGVADFVHVIPRGSVQPRRVLLGTSLSVYASVDRGAHWTKFASNLPSVAVYDLKIHPRDHELMAATHWNASMGGGAIIPI